MDRHLKRAKSEGSSSIQKKRRQSKPRKAVWFNPEVKRRIMKFKLGTELETNPDEMDKVTRSRLRGDCAWEIQLLSYIQKRYPPVQQSDLSNWIIRYPWILEYQGEPKTKHGTSLLKSVRDELKNCESSEDERNSADDKKEDSDDDDDMFMEVWVNIKKPVVKTEQPEVPEEQPEEDSSVPSSSGSVIPKNNDLRREAGGPEINLTLPSFLSRSGVIEDDERPSTSAALSRRLQSAQRLCSVLCPSSSGEMGPQTEKPITAQPTGVTRINAQATEVNRQSETPPPVLTPAVQEQYDPALYESSSGNRVQVKIEAQMDLVPIIVNSASIQSDAITSTPSTSTTTGPPDPNPDSVDPEAPTVPPVQVKIENNASEIQTRSKKIKKQPSPVASPPRLLRQNLTDESLESTLSLVPHLKSINAFFFQEKKLRPHLHLVQDLYKKLNEFQGELVMSDFAASLEERQVPEVKPEVGKVRISNPETNGAVEVIDISDDD